MRSWSMRKFLRSFTSAHSPDVATKDRIYTSFNFLPKLPDTPPFSSTPPPPPKAIKMTLVFKNTLVPEREDEMIEVFHRVDKLRNNAIDCPTLMDQLNKNLPLFKTQVQGLANFSICACNLLEIERQVAELINISTKSAQGYDAALKIGKELSLNIVLTVCDYEYYARYPGRFGILIFPEDFEHKPWEAQNCEVGKELCQSSKCISCVARDHRLILEVRCYLSVDCKSIF